MSEQLGADLHETPEQAALLRMGDHMLRCRTCTATDDEGKNLNLPCATGDRLEQEYHRVRCGGAAPQQRSRP